MLIAEVAIGDILFLSFYYLIVRNEIHSMTDMETFWYRVCRIYFKTQKEGTKHYHAGLPAGGVFGIAWIILYFLYAVAAYIVWLNLWYDTAEVSTLNDEHQKRFLMMQACFIILFVNIFVNKLWTQLFFRSKAYLASLIVIAFIFATIVPVIVMFYYLQFWWSGSLLIPYALWLCYAFYLNWVFYVERKIVTEKWNSLVRNYPELIIYDNDSKIPKDVWAGEKRLPKDQQQKKGGGQQGGP
jgi:tryptophan-rich sensory protein